MLNTEIVIHGSSHKEVSNSTSADTIVDSIDSEIEVKPVLIFLSLICSYV